MRSFAIRWFRFLFFMQAVPAIRKAKHQALEPEDMPALPGPLDPALLPASLLQASVASGNVLILEMLLARKREIILSVALASCYAACVLAGPLLVYNLVEYVNLAAKSQVSLTQGLVAGLSLCLAGALTGLFQHHYFYQCLRISQSISSALNMRIFNHGLRLTRNSRMNRPTGDIVNLLGTDSDIVSFITFEGIELILRIVMMLIAGLMLVNLLGMPGVYGLLSLIIFMPLARRFAQNYMQLDDKIMEYRDTRVSMMSQLLSGIRIVKYFAWEHEMQREVDEVRKQEMAARRRQFRNQTLSLVTYFTASLTVGAVAFLSAIAYGQQLDAATLFAALTIFGILEGSLGTASESVSVLASAQVSATRIAAFLREAILPKPDAQSSGKPFRCEWEQASFQYEDAEAPALLDVTLRLEQGEAIAVVGPVGCGKSTLLLSLLKEVPLVKGTFHWRGLEAGQKPRTAYVPQESFIMNGSLRDNILLGSEESIALPLQQVVWAAALEKDVASLSGGLGAEIGEQGINLSGGQKQRINLARAAMREPELLLLDDPLSAVDFHTEEELLERLVFGLWRDKTRVVVTHRLQHLHRFDRVAFMDQGRIVGIGTFAELAEHHAGFRCFLQRPHEEASDDLRTAPLPESQRKTETLAKPSEPQRLTDDEERMVGGVQFAVYRTYALAWLGKRPLFAGLILFGASLLAVGLPILQQSWLAYWSDHRLAAATASHGAQVPEAVKDIKGAICLWGGLGLSAIGAAALHQRLWLTKGLAASATIHDRSLTALLKAPLSYFDKTPIGRILNRFSRDMDSLEREIAGNLERTIGPILHTLAAMLILIVNIPLLVLAIVPALGGYYVLQKRYRFASRDSQRLTSMARSPRFAFFKETLQAAPVLRAHGQEDAFSKRYEGMMAHYQRMFHASIIFNRWFSSRIPMLGAMITFALIAAILWLSRTSGISAGIAGLSLVYALRLCDHLNNAIRAFTVVESNLIGVERLDQIRDIMPEIQPDSSTMLAESIIWPTEGAIEFRNVSVQYAPQLPMVLKNFNLAIESQQKVGVIGRTGAGKSTLFQSLFRFVVPTEGQVLIDGVDTRRVPLDRLRRALAIIPQDPILFKGSLRRNLDRFAQFDDERVWVALRRSHLEPWVRSLPGGLEAEVKESGSNFSQGQRQQLCLARALLIDTKIIVLDEATASVDVVTDSLIQETLRDECRDKTVLIIAHRLETLGLCDSVVEMKDGVATRLR